LGSAAAKWKNLYHGHQTLKKSLGGRRVPQKMTPLEKASLKNTWAPRTIKKAFSATLSLFSISSHKFSASLKVQVKAMELSESSFRWALRPTSGFDEDGWASSTPTMSPARSSERGSRTVEDCRVWDQGAASSESSAPSRPRMKSLLDMPRYQKSQKSPRTCSLPETLKTTRSGSEISGKPSRMLLTLESVEDWGKCVCSPELERYGSGFHPLSQNHDPLRTRSTLQHESCPPAPADGVSTGVPRSPPA
jgi:hypothetical protein